MSKHLDVVVSRLKNMLTRIGTEDPDFDDLCAKHAEVTARIRRLNPDEDPSDAQADALLRRRRADLEQEMLGIMQANTRV